MRPRPRGGAGAALTALLAVLFAPLFAALFAALALTGLAASSARAIAPARAADGRVRSGTGADTGARAWVGARSSGRRVSASPPRSRSPPWRPARERTGASRTRTAL
ncbi:hypothetical protein ABT298_11530 [Streptomyces sp. NPDC001034]|uniref:hypothetical protein n=1 Tax=Streptomyces sp. NPDC001034 TaxID=3154375 RepID=UPI003320EC2C